MGDDGGRVMKWKKNPKENINRKFKEMEIKRFRQFTSKQIFCVFFALIIIIFNVWIKSNLAMSILFASFFCGYWISDVVVVQEIFMRKLASMGILSLIIIVIIIIFFQTIFSTETLLLINGQCFREISLRRKIHK